MIGDSVAPKLMCSRMFRPTGGGSASGERLGSEEADARLPTCAGATSMRKEAVNASTAYAEPLIRRSKLPAWFAARPRVLDIVVILIATVPQIAALTLQDVPNEWLGQLCVAGGAVALWWRRSRPLAVLLIVAALAGFNPLYSGLRNAGNFEVMFATYALAAQAGLRTTVLGYAASMLIIPLAGTLAAVLGFRDGSLMMNVQPMALVALAIGVAVRASNSRRAAVEELAALREERAVSAERARITAEMHDVVAHSATVMIALAGGARAGWEKHPERARAALEQLGTVGAQALEDMQRTLRVLRDGDATLDTGLAHSGHNIPPFGELTRVFEAAGLLVELRTPDELPDDPALRTTLYRIVQESLTNALRHGTGVTRAEVSITWQLGTVTVTVTDDGDTATPRGGAAQPGFGLRAMRERTAVFGGILEAGPLTPRPGEAGPSGWRTRATIPAAARGGNSA